MKVYTKKGDTGLTGLIGGTRVSKHHIRIEAYGTVDELNSYLGLLRDKMNDAVYLEEILFIQERLFTIGSWLANDESKSNMTLPEIFEDDIILLEKSIDNMDSQLEPMKFFVLPGGHELVSLCHIARCICRRAERCTSALNEQIEQNPLILKFINRLSDYLFVLSRYYAHKLNVKEIPWKPRK